MPQLMKSVTIVAALCLVLSGCVSPYFAAQLGRMGGSVFVMWVGEDKFVYVPGPNGKNFAFETATTSRVIAPGMMYTDGGSIPRVAQLFRGFSRWGFGPAYVVHDWIFYGHHCYVDPDSPEYEDERRFDDVNGVGSSAPITFHESSLILAEVIKTLVDTGQVPPHDFAAEVISSAVDSPLAATLWNQAGQCRRLRVEPRHIAIVWLTLGNEKTPPPSTWKLSASEINQARKYFPEARAFIEKLKPGATPPARQRRLVSEVMAAGTEAGLR